MFEACFRGLKLVFGGFKSCFKFILMGFRVVWWG